MATRKRRGASKKSNRKAIGSRIEVTERAEAAPPPEYLVVFKKVSNDRKVRSLQAAVGTMTARSARSGGKETFAKGGQPKAALYRNFDIAAADLTQAECTKLQEQQGEIVRIVKNELRSIPRDPDPIASVFERVLTEHAPPSASPGGLVDPSWPWGRGAGTFGSSASPMLPFGGGSGPRLPFGAIGGPRLPFGGIGGPRLPFSASPSATLDYLRGYRDAVNLMVAHLEGASEPRDATLPIRAAAMRYAYGLVMIGLGTETPSFTGEGVKVAVLDTGVDTNHPDFNGRFAGGRNTRSFVPDEADAEDIDGHGTHVTGTIVGMLEARPRYGVAANCEVLVAKVLDKTGFGYDSYILDAIDWAIDNNVRVINMSLGSARSPGEEFAAAYEDIATLYLDDSKGPLLIAAAGNESQRHLGQIAAVGNPAACPSVMAVAAVDSSAAVAWFSSGQVDTIGGVDIAAPGVDIHSATPGGLHEEKSGTSMASPHVAGLAALYLQRSPKLTPRELWRMLEQRARKLPVQRQDVGAGLAQGPRIA